LVKLTRAAIYLPVFSLWTVIRSWELLLFNPPTTSIGMSVNMTADLICHKDSLLIQSAPRADLNRLTDPNTQRSYCGTRCAFPHRSQGRYQSASCIPAASHSHPHLCPTSFMYHRNLESITAGGPWGAYGVGGHRLGFGPGGAGSSLGSNRYTGCLVSNPPHRTCSAPGLVSVWGRPA
jgi:hypothetical protein